LMIASLVLVLCVFFTVSLLTIGTLRKAEYKNELLLIDRRYDQRQVNTRASLPPGTREELRKRV